MCYYVQECEERDSFLSIAMTYSNDNVKTLLVLNNDELTEKNFVCKQKFFIYCLVSS